MTNCRLFVSRVSSLFPPSFHFSFLSSVLDIPNTDLVSDIAVLL